MDRLAQLEGHKMQRLRDVNQCEEAGTCGWNCMRKCVNRLTAISQSSII
jgi:hypothetical protein